MRTKKPQKKEDIPEDPVDIEPEEKQDKTPVISKQALFPIIGLGASAGGLEAFEQFVRHIPNDSGMAFVLVSHLDPSHASMLTEILQRNTPMPVVEAKDQMALAPNHIYVIPPNRDMAIFHATLQLSIPEESRGQRMPIDFFLRSLAEDQGEKAIGIILSGSGTDGTLGLRAILGAGGVSFIQDPTTAKYDSMPASVVRNGLATFVLPVEKMPEQLMSYVNNQKIMFYQGVKPLLPPPVEASALNKVFMQLRSKTGHDFSLYKQTTILRRINRRMTVHGLENTETYARYLSEHPDEVQILFKELLINVTSFFRDKEAFTALKTDILPQMFKNKPENYVFRIWVIGCATGEEAYSFAILMREYMDEIKTEFKIQIYGTDIDEDEIKSARIGFYPPNITIDVSSERLRRFFIKEENGFRVRKDIREMVVFASQDVIKDPPFTKLDMLSCRNLLIYLEQELQKHLIPVFHYSLKPDGVLFLGNSESIGNRNDIFASLNRKWKIYQVKKSLSSTRTMLAGGLNWITDQTGKGHAEVLKKEAEINIAELTRRTLLQSYAPASVVTDEKGNILYVYGETGKYLRPAPGQASLNVVEMARDGLAPKLRTAIHNAAMQKKNVVLKDIRIMNNEDFQTVDLTVKPLNAPDAAGGVLLVSFHETEPRVKQKRVKQVAGVRPGREDELEQELLYTKENLQATIEEMQASNEELKSTNEEFQSTNEELQSTNEELETSKEELQSVNEELVTVNSELQAKIEMLTGVQNDMKNLIDNTFIGIIFLDKNLIIKRFTREVVKVFRLTASDEGRPLADLKSNIDGDDLINDAREVLDSFTSREKEVHTRSGEWFMVKILLYRTLDNVIAGVVLTFVDITERKRMEEETRTARLYAESIVDTVREPMIVLDGNLKVISASRSFFQAFKLSPRETVGCYLYDLGDRQWNIPELQELLETILPEDTSFENFEITHEFPSIGLRKMLLNARHIQGKEGQTQLILLAMKDITDKVNLKR